MSLPEGFHTWTPSPHPAYTLPSESQWTPVHQKSWSVSHLQQGIATVESAGHTVRCAGANKREDLAVVECAVTFHVEAIAAKDDKYLFSARLLSQYRFSGKTYIDAERVKFIP